MFVGNLSARRCKLKLLWEVTEGQILDGWELMDERHKNKRSSGGVLWAHA